MNADRHGENQEECERQPRHDIAVQASADGAGDEDVEGDVRRHQPKVDDGVQGPGEQHACKTRIDGALEAQCHGQNLQQDFKRGADRGPCPQVCARDVRVHRERNLPPGVTLAPSPQVHRHEGHPDPGADDDQHDTDVVEGTGNERWVKGIQHGGGPGCHSRCRHQGADRREGESPPRPLQPDERLLEREFDDGVPETHRDQQWEHVCHDRAVSCHRSIVVLRNVDPGVQRAAQYHLPFAQQQRGEEQGKRAPEMRQHQQPGLNHSAHRVDR